MPLHMQNDDLPHWQRQPLIRNRHIKEKLVLRSLLASAGLLHFKPEATFTHYQPSQS